MMIGTIRHCTCKGLSFVVSQKSSWDDYYVVSYEFVKKLFFGVAQRAVVFGNNKYGFVDYPFLYRERQLDSLILPELADLCKGITFAEYPVIRDSRKKINEISNSHGRVDYWCIYKDYSFVIEVKHSYDCFDNDYTKESRLASRWRYMNIQQLDDITKYLKGFCEKTKGVIRIALHFITPWSKLGLDSESVDSIRNKEKSVLIRIANEFSSVKSKYTTPDFVGFWELMDERIVMDDCVYPGLILISKFYEPIRHYGLKC